MAERALTPTSYVVLGLVRTLGYYTGAILEVYDPAAVAEIRTSVDALVTQSLQAVDAYTNGNRVIGNALMAGADLGVGVGDTVTISHPRRQGAASGDRPDPPHRARGQTTNVPPDSGRIAAR